VDELLLQRVGEVVLGAKEDDAAFGDFRVLSFVERRGEGTSALTGDGEIAD
jgi:hypothetical protein